MEASAATTASGSSTHAELIRLLRSCNSAAAAAAAPRAEYKRTAQCQHHHSAAAANDRAAAAIQRAYRKSHLHDGRANGEQRRLPSRRASAGAAAATSSLRASRRGSEAADEPAAAEVAASPSRWRRGLHLLRWRGHGGRDAAAAASVADAPTRPVYALARAAQQRRMPRREDGGAIPLYTELQTFDRLGTDVSQYMHFVYSFSRLCITLFLLNLANIVINVEGAGLETSSFSDILLVVHTLGNTAVDGVLARGGHSYAVIELVSLGLLIHFLFSMRGRFEAIADRIRNGTASTTAADFTVHVSNVPARWGRAQLRAQFEPFGEVVHVGVALDNRALILAMRRAQQLKDKRTDAALHLVGLIRCGASATAISSARRAARRATALAEANGIKVRRLQAERHRCCGHAFVTFNELRAARLVLDRFKWRRAGGGGGGGLEAADAAAALAEGGGDGGGGGGGAFSSIFGGGLAVARAPEPVDIIWENLQCTRREQVLRQLVSVTILLFLTLFSVGLLTGVNLFQSKTTHIFGISTQLTTIMASVTSWYQWFALWLVQTLLIIVGYVFIFIAVPVLAYKYERPHTHGEREAGIMLKLTFFQCLVTLMAAIVVLFVPTEDVDEPTWRFTRQWYPLGGAIVINTLFADLIVINLVVDLARPHELVRKYLLAPRARTQARMDELLAVQPGPTLAFRAQLFNKFVILGLSFSFAIPALYLVMAAYAWLAQWVDRVLWLRLLLPPPQTRTLMRYVINVVLPIAIASHSAFAFTMFLHICYNADGETNNATGTADGCERPALRACSESITDFSSSRFMLLACTVISGLAVASYYLTGTRKLVRKRRAQRLQGKDLPLALSDRAGARLRRLYRFFAQRELRERTKTPSVPLEARMRSQRSGVDTAAPPAAPIAAPHAALDDGALLNLATTLLPDAANEAIEAGAILYVPPLARLTIESMARERDDRVAGTFLRKHPEVVSDAMVARTWAGRSAQGFVHFGQNVSRSVFGGGARLRTPRQTGEPATSTAAASDGGATTSPSSSSEVTPARVLDQLYAIERALSASLGRARRAAMAAVPGTPRGTTAAHGARCGSHASSEPQKGDIGEPHSSELAVAAECLKQVALQLSEMEVRGADCAPIRGSEEQV